LVGGPRPAEAKSRLGAPNNADFFETANSGLEAFRWAPVAGVA
jgi:hypothetical protein